MIDLVSGIVAFLRVFALYLIYISVLAIPAFITGLGGSFSTPAERSAFLIYTGMSIGGRLVLAVVVLLFAKGIARLLTRNLDSTEVQLNESGITKLQAVALSLFGAYLLAYSIPTLARMLIILLTPPQQYGSQGLLHFVRTDENVSIPDFMEFVVQGAIGLGLLVGSTRIAHWLSGRSKTEAAGQPADAAGPQ